MSELTIIFVSIIVIVGMVLTFRLLTLIIDKKHGGESPGGRFRGNRKHRNHQTDTNSPDPGAWQELADRAEALNNRLRNLEEIILSEKEKEEVQ